MSRLPPRVTPFASLPVPPSKIPKYGKMLWYLAKSAGTGVAYAAFDYGVELVSAGGGTADPGADMWTRWQVIWEDTVSLDSADTQVFTIDIINHTNGAVDNTWTSQDFDQVGAAIGGFSTELAARTVLRLTNTEIKAYMMAFNAYTFQDEHNKFPPFAHSGGPAAVYASGVAGSGSAGVPPATRSTITERTPSRPNWGRCYMPTPGAGDISIAGRLLNTAADAYVLAYDNLVSALDANDFYIVVPTTSVGNVPTRSLQNLTAIGADDVLDVQRSGRHHTTNYRKITPTPTTQDVPQLDEAA